MEDLDLRRRVEQGEYFAQAYTMLLREKGVADDEIKQLNSQAQALASDIGQT
jgi:hypothetical protein